MDGFLNIQRLISRILDSLSKFCKYLDDVYIVINYNINLDKFESMFFCME